MNEPISFERVQAAKGHQFPGGEYRIEHWENFLLTACTGGELMQHQLVHPIAMFHVPILGAGTTIAEMFALGQADSDFSISIESYDWQMFEPLREDHTYKISGAITDVERITADQTYDRLVFDFNISQQDGKTAATSTVIWHYRRGLS